MMAQWFKLLAKQATSSNFDALEMLLRPVGNDGPFLHDFLTRAPMSATPIRLLVGLGNPGPDYEETRHNAGFWLIDRLARQQSCTPRLESKFNALYARSGELHMLWPQTYMNRSGMSVAALCRFFKITPEEMLVIHDELDMPPGAARFKQGGGHGGHNGLKDIISAVNTPMFWRLRLGIGHPGDKSQVADFVLKRPRLEEQTLIDTAIEHALDALPAALKGDWPTAMKQLHTAAK